MSCSASPSACCNRLCSVKADSARAESSLQAMLGAMEQQEVTISKAGVCAALPARTAVLAAANPIGGHYTRSKTMTENLKMSAAMLSRFDIVFLLLDKPDEVLDERLSEHIMAIHAGATFDLDR